MIIDKYISNIIRQQPASNNMPALKWPTANTQKPPGVAVEGGNSTLELPLLSPYGAKSRWIDVYSTSNTSAAFSITTDKWVVASSSTGTIKAPGDTADQRVSFSINWGSAPSGKSNSKIKVTAGATVVTVSLPLDNSQVAPGFSGFVESDRAISIEPEHYTSATSSSTASYGIIPNYGRTLSGVTLFPVTIGTQTPPSSPKLTYNIFTFTSTTASITVHLAPTLNYDSDPLTYYISVDDAAPTKAQYVPVTQLGTLPNTWTDSTRNAGCQYTTKHTIKSGAHVLNLWAGGPGVVFQKIVVDLGGVRKSYLGPPESSRV